MVLVGQSQVVKGGMLPNLIGGTMEVGKTVTCQQLL